MNDDKPFLKHGANCKCPKCNSVKEPEIKYTWYKTKTSMMTIECIEYDGHSWNVIMSVKNRYLPRNTQNTWTVAMWNKYSIRWRENEGARE